MSVRGNCLKISERYDFRPVLWPIQNGDEVDNARTWGRKYRDAFMI